MIEAGVLVEAVELLVASHEVEVGLGEEAMVDGVLNLSLGFAVFCVTNRTCHAIES